MNIRLMATLLFVSVLFEAANARERDCLPRKPAQKKVMYCESVPIGSDPIHMNRFMYAASFESKFFDGLIRTKTKQGFVFRKGRQLVTDYPDSFVITVELFSLSSSSWPPREQKPRELVLRWLTYSGAALSETKLPLEEVVEAWPETHIPKVWYRATASRVNEPLSAYAEVVILGEGESRLATFRGSPFER